MHAPEYTARIKALIAAKDRAEMVLGVALRRFRLGFATDPETVEGLKKYMAEVLEIIDPGAAEVERKALATVLDAAGQWRDELTIYVIPHDEQHEGLEETAEGHRNAADEISAAITVLS